MRVQPLRSVAKILKDGGVVLHATETCYGLAADIFNPAAVEKIYALKKMDKGKPVSIMVRGLAEARKYARFNKTALDLAKRYWPGPLTIILPRKKTLPDFLNPGNETVGIRCPDFEVARSLIVAAGGPLVTTSANISGKPQAYSVGEYLKQLRGAKSPASKHQKPDLIIDSGEIPTNEPSTVVEVGAKGGIKVIRQGEIVL